MLPLLLPDTTISTVSCIQGWGGIKSPWVKSSFQIQGSTAEQPQVLGSIHPTLCVLLLFHTRGGNWSGVGSVGQILGEFGA